MAHHLYINPTSDFASQHLLAISLNNAALNHKNAKSYSESERLNLQALEIKRKIYGPNAIQTALTLNAIGELYLAMSRLPESEKYLRDALRIRDPMRDLDAACTREELGKCLEAQGKMEEAKRVRMERPETVVCAFYMCEPTRNNTVPLERLKRCAGCGCVWYCGAACQKSDWVRHKKACKKVMGERKGGVEGANV